MTTSIDGKKDSEQTNKVWVSGIGSGAVAQRFKLLSAASAFHMGAS